MSDNDRGQQRPGQTPPSGPGGAQTNGAPGQPRPEELASARTSRQPTPQTWPYSPQSAPNPYQRPPQHVTQQYTPQPGHPQPQGQQPPRVQGQPNQPPQPFPSGYSGPSAHSAASGQSARSAETPGQLYRPQPYPNGQDNGQGNGQGNRQGNGQGNHQANGQPNGSGYGPPTGATAQGVPTWGAPVAAKPKMSLRERLGLTKPASEKKAAAATQAPAADKSAPPDGQDSTRVNPRVTSAPVAKSDTKSDARTDTKTQAKAAAPSPTAPPAAPSQRTGGAVAGAAAAGAAAGAVAGRVAAGAQPAARQAPVGTPVPAKPEVRSPAGAPGQTADHGPNTLTMPAVPGGAEGPKRAAEASGATAAKVGQPRRTRKARLRLSRLDPWSVMKTSFLFSIAAGIMLVVAVYVVWTVLASSGLFASANEIVGSVISTPGDTTPFRVEDYVNTQKVMGVTALIACIDVVIFTSWPPWGEDDHVHARDQRGHAHHLLGVHVVLDPERGGVARRRDDAADDLVRRGEQAGRREHRPHDVHRDDQHDAGRDREQERRLHDRPRVESGQPQSRLPGPPVTHLRRRAGQRLGTRLRLAARSRCYGRHHDVFGPRSSLLPGVRGAVGAFGLAHRGADRRLPGRRLGCAGRRRAGRGTSGRTGSYPGRPPSCGATRRPLGGRSRSPAGAA